MPQIFDQYGSVISYVHYEEDGDKTIIGQVQDCESIIENNKRLQTLNDGYSPSREFRRMASIPLVVFEGWLEEDGLTWYDYCRMDKRGQAAYRAKRLMSSDWKHMRTVDDAGGYVGVRYAGPRQMKKPRLPLKDSRPLLTNPGFKVRGS